MTLFNNHTPQMSVVTKLQGVSNKLSAQKNVNNICRATQYILVDTFTLQLPHVQKANQGNLVV